MSDEGAPVGGGNPERGTGLYSLMLATLFVGWSLAKELFARIAVPDRPTIANEVRDPGVTPRSADLDLDPESKFKTRRSWGTGFVAFTYALAIAAGVGFLFIYWTGGSNLLLGGTLALCLGGFGSALVLSARWLMAHKEAVEPREQIRSSPGEREATSEVYRDATHEVDRRSMLGWMTAGAMGLFAAIFSSLLRSLGTSPYRSLYDRVWRRGQSLMTEGGKRVTVHSLRPGDSITVYPDNAIGSEKTQTVLIRVHEDLLRLPSGRADWAPLGYIAFSRICTHAGCPVGLFEAHTNLLLCPCHQSTFDVLTGARPTSGPAARSLPQLPLYVDSEGNLRAGGGFSAPPGPGFTGIPL